MVTDYLNIQIKTMMEPQITDYYNEEPYMMKIIDNMNNELSESQKENQILKKKLKLLEGNYNRPFIKKQS